jgi:hypothetical protein
VIEIEVSIDMHVQVHDDEVPAPGSPQAVDWLGRFSESLSNQLQVPQELGGGRKFAVRRIEARQVQKG